MTYSATRRFLFLVATAALLLALALPPALATAEWVFLKNGHDLRGDIVERRDGKITLRLKDGAGTVTLKEDDVAAVEADMPFADRLRDGQRRLDSAPADPWGALRAYDIALRDQDRNVEANCGFVRAALRLPPPAAGAKDEEKSRGAILSEARRRARMVRGLYPTNPDVRLVNGMLQTAAGEFDAADAEFDLAKKLAPGNAHIRAMAELLERENKIRRDAAEAARAAANDPGGAGKPVPLPGERLGANVESHNTAYRLLEWARSPDEVHRLTFKTAKLSIDPQPVSARTWETEDAITQYRLTRVTSATFTVEVDEERWNKHLRPVVGGMPRQGTVVEREQQVTMSGWYYQLKQRYPLADVLVVVKAPYRGGTRLLADAKWDENRMRVVVTKRD
ncbi:MAG: hypothetical protein AB7S36_23095 [Planctomycetota bacterium]